MLFVLVLVAFASSAQGRAVNISNTWVLPEEGFPVFYRYFRDRISWYEADAVCQFHHANLVTVDTTAQYDAVRAYLKELDITSAVWVGLIRSNPDGDFTWTDYRGLSGDGYWSSVPDSSSAPLCAASDPAADYRWEARACGGPMVASFICELPVPQWALGNEGCMVRALPALTILYLPESAAVQLTADCGMAGVKRIQCTGNVKRENLLKDLSCIEDDESLTISGLSSAGTSWTPVTAVDQDTTTAISTEESTATESEDTSTQAFNIKSTSLLYSSVNQEKIINKEKPVGRPNKIYIDKNVNLDIPINNNLQSNDIPKFVYNSNHLIDEQAELLEDEKNRQHKQFHEELARLGNFENIFTQPTDHFVPPLVMAKSKLSDDMTVLSFEEKHAQQLAEQKYIKHNLGIEHPLDIAVSNVNIAPQLNIISTTSTAKALTSSDIVPTKENVRKEQVKVVPKKYIEKLNSPKGKSTKTLDIKSMKSTASTYTTTDISNEILTSEHTTLGFVPEVSNSKQSMSIDLTITLKEPIIKNNSIIPSKINNNSDYNITDSNQIELSTTTEKRPAVTNFNIIASTPTSTTSNTQFIHDIVKITILNENHHNKSVTPTVFEITTLMPVFHEDNKSAENSVVIPEVTSTSSTTAQNDYVTESTIPTAFANELSTTIQSTTENNKVTTIFPSKSTTFNDSITNSTTELHTATKALYTTEYPTSTPMTSKPSENSSEIPHNIFTTEHPEPKIAIDVEIFNYTGIHEDEHEANITEPFEEEDFQSPLLSAANEPIHRPNRSRRPQSNRKLNKFNPFRMLG